MRRDLFIYLFNFFLVKKQSWDIYFHHYQFTTARKCSVHTRWIRSQSPPFLAQQTGVLLEVWLRKQCLGEKEWHAFYFFLLMQLAQLFQRSSLFWTIIKNFSRAEEIKRKRFGGSHKHSKASCFTEFTQGSSLPSYFCSLAPPLAF